MASGKVKHSYILQNRHGPVPRNRTSGILLIDHKSLHSSVPKVQRFECVLHPWFYIMLTGRLVIIRGNANESAIHGSKSHVLQAEPIAVDGIIIAMAP